MKSFSTASNQDPFCPQPVWSPSRLPRSNLSRRLRPFFSQASGKLQKVFMTCQILAGWRLKGLSKAVGTRSPVGVLACSALMKLNKWTPCRRPKAAPAWYWQPYCPELRTSNVAITHFTTQDGRSEEERKDDGSFWPSQHRRSTRGQPQQ